MNANDRIIPLVMESLDRLIDAQTHANYTNRELIGKEIDRVRWEVGELLCKLQNLLFRSQVIIVYRDGSPMPHLVHSEHEAGIVLEYARTHNLAYTVQMVDTPDQ